ncbi:MAG: PHP domain-containing protein [Kiritimatiellae bacterium]|nr:PHP domain-containing protein [Kiritimatiellia bacterium]
MGASRGFIVAIDLHMHSVYSGGGHDFPDTIFRYARARGLSAIVLTEHDTVDSLPEAMAAAAKWGVDTVPGIEITCGASVVGRHSIHVLAYFFDADAPAFQALATRMDEAARKREQLLAAALQANGTAVSADDLSETERRYYPEAVGRRIRGSHAYGILRGTARRCSGLSGRKIEEIAMQVELPALDEVCASVRLAGGITMWAHPLSRQPLGAVSEFKRAALRLFELGLDGFEAISYKHSPDVTRALVEFARACGRPYSGGGDCHAHRFGCAWEGCCNHAPRLGTLDVPDEVLSAMRRYWQRRGGRWRGEDRCPPCGHRAGEGDR